MERSIACRVICDFSEIETFAQGWRSLQARSGTCLFTGYEWFCGWWHTVGQHTKPSLHVVIAFQENQIVGVLQLVVRKRFGLRILEWASNDIFDYCTTLADSPHIAALLWKTARASSRYDFALIKDVCPHSTERELLSGSATKIEHGKAPYMRLQWKSGQDWLKSREKKFRRDISYNTQRLQTRGPIHLEVTRHGRVPADVIDKMVLHKTLWFLTRGKKGIFSSGLIRSVFRRMADLATEQDKLFLATLTCGGTPVSYIFGFIDRGTLFCYFTCYDPDWAAYSPGKLIFAQTISWAIDNGIKEYDFMRGIEPYKLRYATDVRDLPTFVFARTFRGHCGAPVCQLCLRLDKRARILAKRLPPWMQKRLLLLRKSNRTAFGTT